MNATTIASLPTNQIAWRARPVPARPTRFEELVAEQGLENRPELWPYNRALSGFAKRNRTKHYVPESYLAALGLSTEVEL
jgi:hypothetical protein